MILVWDREENMVRKGENAAWPGSLSGEHVRLMTWWL